MSETEVKPPGENKQITTVRDITVENHRLKSPPSLQHCFLGQVRGHFSQLSIWLILDARRED